jgi:hypothetical protein
MNSAGVTSARAAIMSRDVISFFSLMLTATRLCFGGVRACRFRHPSVVAKKLTPIDQIV